MTRRKIEKTGSYQAKDAAGKLHTIDVYTELIEATGLSDTAEKWVRGMQSHKMAANGHHVNVKSDGTLEDVVTGQKMQKV